MAEGTMTPGDEAVGLDFNPSGDEKVKELKELFARAFNIVEGNVPILENDDSVSNARRRKMRDAALHEIITAQMWAVKVITYKH